MSLSQVANISIDAIYTSVPKVKMDNLNDDYIGRQQGEKILDNTGIRYRHIAIHETAADLCYDAAQKLISENRIDKHKIEFLVFVSQTPDYVLPASATILQDRLGLKSTVAAFDVNMGCSGYVYGLSIISSLLSNSLNKDAQALLLVGDTISKLCKPSDSATYPLFGDAGSATLLVKSSEGQKMTFDLNSDGSGCEAIKVQEGGFKSIDKDGEKTLYLNGMDVFSFGITTVPKAIKSFMLSQEAVVEDFDYFILHQANKFMNEKIRKKIKATEEQVPYCLFDYANTSCSTIPLTITSQLISISTKVKLFLCGFGVGLSWASAIVELTADCKINNSIYNG